MVDGSTPLLAAALNGHLEIVRYLLGLGVVVDAPLAAGATPLYAAAQNGHADIAKLLLSFNADPAHANSNGATPLFIAGQKGHAEVVAVLVAASPASMALTNRSGATPLYVAAQNGRAAAVRCLLAAQADANASLRDGATPLFTACLNGHLEVVTALCGVGADASRTNSNGASAAYVAAQGGHLDILKFLVEHTAADLEAAKRNGHSPLHIACQNGHLPVVEFLAQEVRVAQRRSNDGVSPLQVAAAYDRLPVVRFLVEVVGTDPNSAAPQNGVTPLFAACQRGAAETAAYLAQLATAQIDHRTSSGTTAMAAAALEGHVELVRILLDARANPTIVRNNQSTPLQGASGRGHLQVAELLLQRGAAVTPPAVKAAAQGDHLPVVQLLAGYAEWNGARVVEAAGTPGASVVPWLAEVADWNALHFTCLVGDTNRVTRLLRAGYDPRGVTNMPTLAPEVAALCGGWSEDLHHVHPPHLRALIGVLMRCLYKRRSALHLPLPLIGRIIDALPREAPASSAHVPEVARLPEPRRSFFRRLFR
eukprot:TRINITY_DN9031_c0_g2_i1.p1 TRINITY_DN9031_c0_g2~~TRINITY_DN9031_c0_g2_i1.p1  ORF type:complete len:537 (-),score=115.20 TRINITY_DN9031_c0_g2_i1:88-1698(-)